MKLIPLCDGQVAIVDDEDFDRLSRYKWRPFKPHNVTYAMTSLSRRDSERRCRTVLMHTLVLEGGLIDHVNRNGLDNRRSNLRVATPAQNAVNGRHRGGTSRFQGVGFHKRTGTWRAYIRVDGRQRHLGHFADEEAAAKAYNAAALNAWGEFASLNDV